MSCRKRGPLLLLALVTLLSFSGSEAAELHGNGNFGFWYVGNNVSNGNGFLVDDGYGSTYVQNHYMLANLGLRLDAKNILERASGLKLHAHVKGRLLWNLGKNSYALAIPDKTRQQIDDFSLELVGVASSLDLWFGRQTLYEAGGVGVDGVRAIYHLSPELGLGVYGGLTNDPRNLTGYIGPAYRSRLFSSDFQAAGAYLTNRTDRFMLDAALNAQLYKAKLDRFTLFTQSTYRLTPNWTLSGIIDFGLAGDTGLKRAQAMVISRPTSRVTNTLSFTRFVSLRYKESDASAIPVPSGVDATLVNGNEVETSSYNIGREHIQIRIFNRNFIFAAFQFARRTFDNKNQLKYTAGYRDPRLFGSSFDLRFQTDVIDNYRGFNTLFDTIVGREFLDGRLRLEGGVTYYANERDQYVGNSFVAHQSEVEKEYSLRFNLYGYATKKISWVLNYALHNEKDLAQNRQKIRIHDLYVGSNFRF